jgi:hypothetical protein
MGNIDSDFRFMATNDLFNELQKDDFILDASTETKVIDSVLKLLSDSNSEVQNMAIKWYRSLMSLEPLASKIRKVLYVCQSICSLLDQESDTKRDIAALGLKTFLAGLLERNTEISALVGFMVPKLLLHLKKVLFSH